MASAEQLDACDLTFETKCWERDWRIVLEERHCASLFERHLCEFKARVVLVNNVEDPLAVLRQAETLVSKGILTACYYVPDFIEASLLAFGLGKADLGTGFWYSVAELVGLSLCETKYLLHYASDTVLAHSSDWPTRACKFLEQTPTVACANPLWNGRLLEARRTAVSETDDYFLGRGFSDQCYLVEAARWRFADFHAKHAASEVYPQYGGGLFERRADSWMRNENLLRATDRTASYVHPFL